MSTAQVAVTPVVPESRVKLEKRNLVELFESRVERSGPRVALRRKIAGRWEDTTWQRWREMSLEVGAGLMSLGAQAGDRVCILANTRLEWLITDIGGLMAGLTVVPIYQSSTAEQAGYIVADSEARFVFAEDPEQVEKLCEPEVAGQVAKVAKVIYFQDRVRLEKPDAKGRIELRLSDVLPREREGWVMSLDALRTEGRSLLASRASELEERARSVGPDDLLTLVYTSGTTGHPKGVMLTHGNVLSEIQLIGDLLPVTDDDQQLLYLPLAHIFARMLEFVSIKKGVTTAFAESIPKLVENLGEIRPSFFGSVPRIYEKVYAKVQGQAAEGGTVKKAVFDWAVGVGKQVSNLRQQGRSVPLALEMQYRVAERLVFSKLQEKLGGRVKFMISGGAPLGREIAEFFHAAGLLVLEAYGLTETTGATSVNRPERFRFGTVGPVIPGVEVRFADDDEILVRGPHIMKGYYKQPEATREVLEPDGWFHTGDIGKMEDGFLRITDRKKDLIKTSGGKYVAPQNLENLLKQASPLVSQAMIHGDNRKFVSALITLDEENLRSFAQGRGVMGDYATLAQRPEVKDAVQVIVDQVNARCASFEAIKKFAILPRDLSQEAGELTPTLKVKRKVVTEKYRSLLDGFYA
jgi:long-chain acyl-CoA synthetase